MQAVPQQVVDFIKASAPLDKLPAHVQADMGKHANLIYLSAESKDELLKENAGRLFLVSSGQFSVKDSDGAEQHLSEGDFFGYASILDSVDYALSVTVDKPGLVYCFTQDDFKLALSYSSVEDFFQKMRTDALQNQAVEDSNSMWLYKSLSEIIERQPIATEDSMSIQSGAALMAENKVSCLLITTEGQFSGIVTDRDLRNKVVAQALDVRLPLSTIMTADPVKINQYRTMFDAMACMSEHNIHHLPVVDRLTNQPMGIVTTSDVVRLQKGNVLFIIGELSEAENLYELTRLSWQMPHYFATHAKRPGDFDIAGKVLSQATDIMTRKLINFFQRDHGHAPMAYTWIVYGSQAREDQTMGSDQDNGLLLEREPNAEEASYFEQMGSYVCGGLAKCGIKLCEGNIMASNPALRLSIDAAIKETEGWIRQPTSQNILNFNIYLDARAAAGDVSLFQRLQAAREPLLKQKMFLAALARQANEVRIPLSMFSKFVYDKRAPRKDAIDLKTKAIASINNLVRLYALANGIATPSTLGRLNVLPAEAGLVERDNKNLRDIWLFLNRLRWRHQLQNKVTDNYVAVNELSSIERHQLKSAFKAIERAQQAAVMKFSGGIA